MTKRFQLNIHGTVQGVYYRKSTRNKAMELGLTGFVRNEADGSVYCEVEGERSVLNFFIEWCRVGPEQAQVERLDVLEVPPLGGQGFEILR
jgi:acylphosphatase